MSRRPTPEALAATPPLQLAAVTVSLGALAALAAAYGFEYLGGYEPCPLCLIERLAYYFAVPAGFLALILAYGGERPAAQALLAACALGFLANAGLGVYHSGVEWGWWPGPETCSGADATGFSTGGLAQSLEQARVIRCDQAPWRFLGLSFAGWSTVISLLYAAIGIWGIGGIWGIRSGRRGAPTAG